MTGDTVCWPGLLLPLLGVSCLTLMRPPALLPRVPGPDLQSGHSGPVGTQPGETIVGLIFLNLVKGQAENNFYLPVYDGLVHGLVGSQCKLDLLRAIDAVL